MWRGWGLASLVRVLGSLIVLRAGSCCLRASSHPLLASFHSLLGDFSPLPHDFPSIHHSSLSPYLTKKESKSIHHTFRFFSSKLFIFSFSHLLGSVDDAHWVSSDHASGRDVLMHECSCRNDGAITNLNAW